MSSKAAGFRLWVPRLDGNNLGGKTGVEKTGGESTGHNHFFGGLCVRKDLRRRIYAWMDFVSEDFHFC